MKSVLLIRLPNNTPDLEALSQESFCESATMLWELNLYNEESQSSELISKGHSLLNDMPVADMAIAIMPGSDVRLLQMNLPLVNSKKLSQILPNLIEDRLLSGSKGFLLHVLPPSDGTPALQRTVAVINQRWHEAIAEALRNLNVQHVQIVPESLCVKEKVLGYLITNDKIEFTLRHSEQAADSWQEDNSRQETVIQEMIEFTKASNAQENNLQNLKDGAFQLIDSHINLLAKIPKRKNQNTSFKAGAWLDKNSWKNVQQWLSILIISFIVSINGYFVAIVLIDLNWRSHMTELASTIVEDKSKDSVKQLMIETSKLFHINGLSSISDIDHLSSKVQSFTRLIGQDGIQQIQYDGLSARFELKKPIDMDVLKSKIKESKLNIDIVTNRQLIIHPLPLMKQEGGL